MIEKLSNQKGLLVAVCAAVLFTLVFGARDGWLGIWPMLAITVAMTAVFHSLSTYLWKRKVASYQKRIEANEGPEWDVAINGVKVGTVSDGTYASMQLRAMRDGRNLLAQLCNTMRIGIAIVSKLLVAFPLMFFWLIGAYMLFSPETVAETLAALQTASPEELASVAVILANMLATLAILMVGAMFIFGSKFGYRDYYDEAVGRMVRYHVNTPADGALSLTRLVTNDVPGDRLAVTNASN